MCRQDLSYAFKRTNPLCNNAHKLIYSNTWRRLMVIGMILMVVGFIGTLGALLWQTTL